MLFTFKYAAPLRQLLQIGGTTTAENSSQLLSGSCRNSAYFRSGAVKPKPEEMPLGIPAAAMTIVPGLFVGAMISKTVANFLEENDLFVPSDDDDDDD